MVAARLLVRETDQSVHRGVVRIDRELTASRVERGRALAFVEVYPRDAGPRSGVTRLQVDDSLELTQCIGVPPLDQEDHRGTLELVEVDGDLHGRLRGRLLGRWTRLLAKSRGSEEGEREQV